MKNLPKSTIMLPKLGLDKNCNAIFVTFPPGTMVFDKRYHSIFLVIVPASDSDNAGVCFDYTRERSWKMGPSKFIAAAVIYAAGCIIEAKKDDQRQITSSR
jgi:hypothetical protein